MEPGRWAKQILSLLQTNNEAWGRPKKCSEETIMDPQGSNT